MRTVISSLIILMFLLNKLLSDDDCLISNGVYTSVKNKCLLQARGIDLIHMKHKSYFSNHLNWSIEGTELNDTTIVLVLPDSNNCENSFIFLTQSNQIKQITRIQNILKDSFNISHLNACEYVWTTSNANRDLRIVFPVHFQFVNKDTILQTVNIYDIHKSIGTIILLYHIDKNGDVHQIKEKAFKGLVCVGQDGIHWIQNDKKEKNPIVLCLETTENKFNWWSIFNILPLKNAPKKWLENKTGRYLYSFDRNLNIISHSCPKRFECS